MQNPLSSEICDYRVYLCSPLNPAALQAIDNAMHAQQTTAARYPYVSDVTEVAGTCQQSIVDSAPATAVVRSLGGVEYVERQMVQPMLEVSSRMGASSGGQVRRGGWLAGALQCLAQSSMRPAAKRCGVVYL